MEEAKELVKPWEKPWTTEEMRQQSANWNLAGDAGLLKHLQEFSQNLLAQTHATEVTLDSLMEELRATSTDVSNVTNQFLCLANTQFVENRVYDDDEKETPPEEKKEEEKPKSKEEQEAEVVVRVREALGLGISVLDTMFDAVEVPASDSEDEESGGRVVLEPHNPYLNRPLPYLIGSPQFMEDDNVGLGSQSDSEETGADKNLVQSSESESEMDVEEKEVSKKRTRLSSTSVSENSDFGASDNSDLGPGPGKQKKMDNSGLFGNVPPTNSGNMFGGDSPTDEIGVFSDGTVKRDSFAAELAAKLGGVAAEAGLADQSAPKLKNSVSKPSMVWEDEDDDDGLFGRRDGKYSGGRGLFDDLDDSPESLWNAKEKHPEKGAAVKQPSLFGPDTENEDDIFSAGASRENKETKERVLSVADVGVATSTPITDSGFEGSENHSDKFNAPKKSSLFDGEDLDDNLFDAQKTVLKDSEKVTEEPKHSDTKKKKKPVGGVSMFGSVDVFKAGIRRPPSSSSCSSDESEQPQNKSLHFNTSHSISSITKISSEHQDSTKSKVNATAAGAKKVSLFDGDDDNLFDPVISTSQNPQRQPATAEPGNCEPHASSNLFQEDDTSDSLFTKPQKSLTFGSAKSATGGSSTSKQPTATRKPTSLFNDSDSGDDELLFSSTSSSSRSRRSQGSGDLLATSGDKVKPPVVQKKGLFEDEDALFGGLKDEPGFDIFSTGNNAAKSNSKNLGSGDLFGDGEDNIFKSSNSTSAPATQDKIKNGSKDILFGDDDSFDIFSNSTKSQKNVHQVIGSNKNISIKNSEPVKSTSGGLFSDDPVDDIFAIPNSAQEEQIPSKATATDNLLSGNSAVISDIDDLFSDPVNHKQNDKDIPKIDGNTDQTDDIFSIPKTVNSIKVAIKNETLSKDIIITDTNILSKSENVTNSVVAEVSTEQNDVKSLGLFNTLENESDTDLFSKSAVGPPISKKPVIPIKPVVKQKPKIPTTPKPSLLKNSPEQSDVKSSVEKNTSQSSSNANTKQTAEEKVFVNNSESEKIISVPDYSSVNSKEKAEKPSVKEPSDKPTKLEPPKTLNIRKTTELLFSSSSNEEEDLFGLNFSSKHSSNLSSSEIVDDKVKERSPPDSQGIDKPKLFSTDKRSKSEKEISSKLEFGQENVGSGIVKARSVGASPRQLNIDPSALLPGAKPPPRDQHNTEAAVSFDHPAQLNATLHSAGKERARIQVKRRPPSRKARQEAVRNSGLDFEGFETAAGMSRGSVISSSLPKESDSLSKPNVPSSSDNVQIPPDLPSTKENVASFLEGSSNNLLSPSTDEEDLFGVPQDLPSEYESSKDNGQSLFTSAPVLSPLEFKSDSLPIFPEEISSTETATNNVNDPLDSNGFEHINKILKDPLNKMPLQTDDNLPSENIPDDENDVYDSFRNEPPADDFDDEDEDDDSSDLFSVSKKKISPLRKENDLFELAKDSDSLFSTVKSLPKVDMLHPIEVKTEVSSSPGEVENPQKENKVLQNDPLLFDNENKPVFQDIPKSESSDELFSSGSTKQSDDLLSSKKSSSEKVHDDLFLPLKSDKISISYGVKDDDDLFSSIKTIISKDSKSRSSQEKSNIIVSKQENSVDNNSLFTSGKQSKFLSPEDDLFSSIIKGTNSQKTSTPEKKENSNLFGGDSPEGDDLFFSTSKKNVGSTVTKGKSGVVSGTLVKDCLFDEDEDDEIFGGSVKSHASNRQASIPIDSEDLLFGSSSTKKKPQVKVSNPTASISSRQAAKEVDDLFEDPLMVVTKK